MLILVLPDAAAVARHAAAMVAGLVVDKPDLVLGLAAGATPQGLYAELVRHQAAGLDLSHLHLFQLDDYLDLDPNHPASCTYALRRHFIDPIGIDANQVHLLGDPGSDTAAYCAAYETSILQAGGLDLQLLGLGQNGHIGFNEPGCSLSARTHLVGLSQITRRTNGPQFQPPTPIPTAAITMGVGTILAARRVLLLATGPAKAAMVAAMVEGPLTARIPASALQNHPDAVVLLDEAAAAELAFRADYDAEIIAHRRPGSRMWTTPPDGRQG